MLLSFLLFLCSVIEDGGASLMQQKLERQVRNVLFFVFLNKDCGHSGYVKLQLWLLSYISKVLYFQNQCHQRASAVGTKMSNSGINAAVFTWSVKVCRSLQDFAGIL